MGFPLDSCISRIQVATAPFVQDKQRPRARPRSASREQILPDGSHTIRVQKQASSASNAPAAMEPRRVAGPAKGTAQRGKGGTSVTPRAAMTLAGGYGCIRRSGSGTGNKVRAKK